RRARTTSECLRYWRSDLMAWASEIARLASTAARCSALVRQESWPGASAAMAGRPIAPSTRNAERSRGTGIGGGVMARRGTQPGQRRKWAFPLVIETPKRSKSVDRLARGTAPIERGGQL